MGEPKFEPKFLNLDVKYNSKYYINIKPYVNQCVRCKKIQPIGACPNCGDTVYAAGQSTDGALGIFCNGCSKGFTRWTCPDCETDNAVSKTFGTYEKSGCFIATATYDSPYAPEVVALRNFRDEVLTNYIFGRCFIRSYYFFSPILARLVSSSEFLKSISKSILSNLVSVISNRKESRHE